MRRGTTADRERTGEISQARAGRPGGAHFFVIPSGVSIERLRHIDPDRDWTDMRLGRERWVVQPYARLRARGWDVTLGSDVPSTGLVVYHKETHREVLRRVPRGGHPVLIACRADFRSADEADFEVVQNGCHADSVRVFFVPFWPQPGLIPRDPARGHTVENVAFKGHIGNLTPELRGPEFQRFLVRHGMRFVLDTLGERDASVPVPAAWHGAWTGTLVGPLATLLTVSLALTAVFVALAFCIAVRCEDKLRGLAIAMAVWMAFAVLYDGAVLLLGSMFADASVERPMLAAMLANPVDLARVVMLLQLDISALLGYTGAVLKSAVGSAQGLILAIVALSLWVAVPLWLGGRSFVRKDF